MRTVNTATVVQPLMSEAICQIGPSTPSGVFMSAWLHISPINGGHPRMGGDTEGAAARALAERMPLLVGVKLTGLHSESGWGNCNYERMRFAREIHGALSSKLPLSKGGQQALQYSHWFAADALKTEARCDIVSIADFISLHADGSRDPRHNVARPNAALPQFRERKRIRSFRQPSPL